MVFRPLEVIVGELLQQIQAVLPEANVLPGSVIREAFINAPAAQISLLHEALESVRAAQTINTATGADLDRIAGNFGLIRDGGRPAVGQLTLILSNSIVNRDVLVLDGTTISTSDRSNPVDFAVIGSHTFRPIDKDFFAAEATRLQSSLRASGITNATYVAVVPITALRAGSIGNVGALSVVRGNIPGVTSLINLTPTVGGTDIESDDSLRRRISLVLSGNSTGTVEGLIALALSNPNVTDAIVVRPGDPLMTRDGSQFDTDGNLVKEGTGRDVDLYIRGSQFITQTESFVFNDNSNGEPVSLLNNFILGRDAVTTDNLFAKQPINSVSDLTGSVSGNNFKQGQEITDEEGNVILDGNYILLKDFEANAYSIVKDNETGETKVSKYLSPINTKFTIIEQLKSSDKANSALGIDSVMWLTNIATIGQEVVARGTEFNGSDVLAHSGVAQIGSVEEDVVLTKESILISGQSIEQDAFIVFTKHSPIVEIVSIRHSRLGFNYDFQIIDSTIGKIQLIGRHPPQQNDIIQISYTWRQHHLQNIEYFLQGDNVKWLREPFERPVGDGSVLLIPTTLQNTLDLQIQPLTPTYLSIEMSQLTARGRYDLTIKGDKARIITGEQLDFVTSPSFQTDDFVFHVRGVKSSTASRTRVGRVIGVKNLSKGYSYSIENMALNTNLYDPSVRVEPNLADNEFLLDSKINTLHLSVGDKVQFSRKALLRHWTTTEDFTNNISGNSSPVFDPITTRIENDEVTVKRQEDDRTSPTTTLAGSISTSGILSGIVDIVDNIIIESGTTVIIQPNTVIRVRDRRSLNAVETYQEQVVLDNLITDTDIETSTDIQENVYIFQKPNNTTAPFFVILNDTATNSISIFYNRDVIRKVVSERDIIGFPTSFQYYIKDRLIPSEFIGLPSGQGLLGAINTIPATFLGYRKVEIDLSTTFIAKSTTINGRSQYGVFLTKTPRTTGLTTDDFSFFQASNPEAIFTDISYDSDRNVFLIDGLAVQSSYKLEYFINVVNRLSIRVRGVLQTSSDVNENNPVIFTSSSTTPEAGDWEGIIFEPSSRTGAPGNAFVTSLLANATIKYARIGIQNNTSDPFVDRCLIKSCSDTGYSLISNFFYLAGVTRADLRLLSNDFSAGGRSYAENRQFGDAYGYGYGYGDGYGANTSTRTLSLPITNLLTTQQGKMPSFTKIGNVINIPNTDTLTTNNFASKYTVDLVSNTDFAVYIDGNLILPGVDADFAIEYDHRRGGFMLSFFNTTLTLTYLTNLGSNPGNITIDYYAVYSNGTLRDSILVDNGNVAIDIDNTAFLTMRNNTIHNNGFYGITLENSYAVISNNLITEYDIAPILQDSRSVASITTNDMWSLPIANSEQNEIASTDRLVVGISESDLILTITTPALYKRNSVIKIDDEFMQVQGILGDHISVIRGFNDTTPTTHKADADIFIQRTKIVFTISGVPGEFCQIREANSDGSLIANRVPVDMIKIASNTFRISFTVDRSSTFFYRYQFKENLSDLFWTLSETRRVFSFQFGTAVNNFINPNHESNLSVDSLDDINYSDNPEYEQPEFENFKIPDNSPASSNNPIYATPFDPSEPRLRFLGQLPIEQSVNLFNGTATILLNSTPIVTTALQNDVIVQLASNPNRRLIVSSYNNTTKTLTLATPVSSAEVGAYQVIYNTPITLGSSRSPLPLITTLQYTFNEDRIVDFTKIDWRETGGSGNIKARFRVANSLSDLTAQAFSPLVDESPFDLSFGSNTYPRGAVIQFEITLETNDKGFKVDGTPVFPKLEDMSLFLTPARDNLLYKVLNTGYDTRDAVTIVTIEDDERQGQGIRDTTFVTVGDGEVLSIIARRAVDNFAESAEFIVGEAAAITINQTEIRVKGDITIERELPSPNDSLLVDYIYVDVNDVESMSFIENGIQITENRFYRVTNINSKITIDKVVSTPAGEQLSINSTSQPAPGTQYLVTYDFAAPVNGESITLTYTYNDTVRVLAQSVESERVLTSDILVRAGFEIPIRVEANILVASGFSSTSIIVDITNALNLFFNTFTGFGGTIRISDVHTTMSNILGVDSVTLNVLSRSAAATVDDIVLNGREYPALAVNNPILTIALTSAPNQVVATNSI